jgi:hypothetical protein
MPVLSLQGVLLNGTAPAAGVQPLAPAQQTIHWPSGEDGTVKLAVVDPTGAVVNVAGGSFKLGLRHRFSDTAPVLSRAGTITDAPNGKVSFALAAADTSALDVDTYRYDVWYTDSGGKRWQVVPASDFVIGEIELKPSE